ncbi:hypothetical protein PsYK624_098050 [Phanerochaete sordida]|uniref:Transmembrane protein 188 n=1 Tax=Phanerochaete sordida TaxID=48140 RepID=A0A9P3GH87_9APHY|nr:hypothetical protein PsYK624_098050 [Phanerochaete sordida]
MPPRLSSVPRNGAFYPASDPATYRDLLLFEERLKTNAASLNRRKHRYQLFLVQLLLIIAFLLSEVLLQTNLLSVPYTWVLRRILPDIYGPAAGVRLPRYLTLGLLCVSVTTLALFFLSGMYSEKIGYANKYVPHANRALRNLNMYLNVRQPPLRSKLPFARFFALLFPRTPSSPPPASPAAPAAEPRTGSARRRSPSPAPAAAQKRASSVPLAPIPPAQHPRGELIFSSRVDRHFRDAYERYRAAFERRRGERERAAHEATWAGWLAARVLRVRPPAPAPAAGSGAATPVGVVRAGSAVSVRGRASPAGTPSSSRRSSPVPRRSPRSSLAGQSSLSTAVSSEPERAEPASE